MKEKSNAFGIASFVCGLVSMFVWIMPYFGIILSICGIVFYSLQLKRYSNGLNTAGLILSILGTLINIVMLLLVLFFVAVVGGI